MLGSSEFAKHLFHLPRRSWGSFPACYLPQGLHQMLKNRWGEGCPAELESSHILSRPLGKKFLSSVLSDISPCCYSTSPLLVAAASFTWYIKALLPRSLNPLVTAIMCPDTPVFSRENPTQDMLLWPLNSPLSLFLSLSSSVVWAYATHMLLGMNKLTS